MDSWDLINFCMWLPVIVIVGNAYLVAENFVIGEVMSEYLPEKAALVFRVLWTVMFLKYALGLLYIKYKKNVNAKRRNKRSTKT